MSRKAEKAEPVQPQPAKPDKFDEQTLIEMKRWAHQKRVTLQGNPQSPDYQAVYQFEQHLERRLREIAWQRYKKEKGIE